MVEPRDDDNGKGISVCSVKEGRLENMTVWKR